MGFLTETLSIQGHTDSKQKKPWDDNSVHLRTNCISRQHPIPWKGCNMKTCHHFKYVIPTDKGRSVSKRGERICFIFSLHKRSTSVWRRSILDMGEYEEAWVYPHRDLSQCSVRGVELRRVAVWSATRGLNGICPEKATLTQTQHVGQTWYRQGLRLGLLCVLKW